MGADRIDGFKFSGYGFRNGDIAISVHISGIVGLICGLALDEIRKKVDIFKIRIKKPRACGVF